MKVKFANKVFEVLYTMETAGLTMYAVEDEPNHIDWLTNVEVVDYEKERVDNETEIPYGAKDSELIAESYYIPKGFHAEIDDDKVVVKKGEKPTAWSEEDEEILRTIISDGIRGAEFDMLQIDWLKSIKNKYAWKPSDEQMDALQYVCRNLNPPLSDKLGWDSLKTLELLYKILKKLYLKLIGE